MRESREEEWMISEGTTGIVDQISFCKLTSGVDGFKMGSYEKDASDDEGEVRW